MSIKDIHPRTEPSALNKSFSEDELSQVFSVELVAGLVGMHPSFIRKVLRLSRSDSPSLDQVMQLLDMDAFRETFVQRSRVPEHLLHRLDKECRPEALELTSRHEVILGSATNLIPALLDKSVNCVVTSTPYWGTRLYENAVDVTWADGEVCPLGFEQTPEGFIRHTVEILYLLRDKISLDGSVWWNLMDTYNTRTQIRTNAAETLRAMNGEDKRGWKDYAVRRYSAGHSYLKDGEKCLIASRVAARASRIGYWVKSVITWKKEGSMPETVSTRVTREAEQIIHLSLQRAPYFDKSAFHDLPKSLGGRNPSQEFDKITDIWVMPTSHGAENHGAQFPIGLPARCIALSTRENDLVLDPFLGSGTTSLAAAKLDRRSAGFDVFQGYIDIARRRLETEISEKELQRRLL